MAGDLTAVVLGADDIVFVGAGLGCCLVELGVFLAAVCTTLGALPFVDELTAAALGAGDVAFIGVTLGCCLVELSVFLTAA
ncbi:hypothetical protein D3C73_1248540 [compost metagenome]